MIYVDSSFLVSHYLQDAHSSKTRQRMASFPQILFTPFQRAELVHAVYQHVFRQVISLPEADNVLKDIEQDCIRGVWVQAEQPLTTFNTCIRIAQKYVATLGVRTLDSLHVAAALELKADVFWTFDERQKRLAEAEGLATA
jgi:predicted nucleic acid-binding protein